MPFPNQEILTVEALTELLGQLKIPGEPLLQEYQTRDYYYRVGLSALLNDLKVRAADDRERKYIIDRFATLMKLRYKEGAGTAFDLLAEAFTKEQRILVCYKLLELTEQLGQDMFEHIVHTMDFYGEVCLFQRVENPEKFAEIMYKRLMNLDSYLVNLNRDPTMLRLKNPAYGYALTLTGSDAHNLGGQAVILSERQGRGPWIKKWVVKPHNMYMERAAADAFQMLNQLLFPHHPERQIPSPVINASNAPAASGSSEFLTKVEARTPEDAEVYFGQMGVLICYAKLLGMSDAHQDNVFSTQEGPTVIDAENVFDQDVMRSDNLFCTCTNMALTIPTGDGDEMLSNNAFFVDEVLSTDLVAHYSDAVRSGYRDAVEACYTKRTLVAQRLETIFLTVPKIRVVPLATKKFHQMAEAYYMATNPLKEQPNFKTLLKKLENRRISMPRQDWEELLATTVAKSLNEGDIPYFELCLPASGADIAGLMTCDRVPVCQLSHLFLKPFDQLVLENLDFLRSANALVQLRDCLGWET